MNDSVAELCRFFQGDRDEYRKKYARLAHEQKPKILFITCCDSRIVPHLITGLEPGDLFVVRTVGAIVPQYGMGECSVGAALDFALETLPIRHIIVCGHSDCGVIKAMFCENAQPAPDSNLARWVQCAELSLSSDAEVVSGVCDNYRIDQMAQKSVVAQLEHLKSYPVVVRKIQEERVVLHGWYFDLASAELFSHSDQLSAFEQMF